MMMRALGTVLLAGLVACSAGGGDEDVASGEGAATAAAGVHTPAPGSPERTAFFEGVRREFDRRVQSNPAPGTKDVEFDVSGDGILRLASRDGVMWGFMAGKAVKPGTRDAFDFSHAPESVKAEAEDEDGKVDNRVYAIVKQNPNGTWDVANLRGYPELYFALTDVPWQDLPCTSRVPFGILEGATASQAECAGAPKCHDEEQALTKVPAANLGEIVKGFSDDGATQVTTTSDGAGTFTVSARFSVCK
jgi:hypothetical protein